MKLIIFDKDKTVSYFGESKLQFIKTKTEKCLKFALIDKDHEETLTSSFDHIYIRKSNLLCCLADQESNPAFISVFPNQEKCEQIYNAIIKATSQQSHPDVSAANDDEIFKDIFYIPLLKSIQASTNDYQELKTIALDFINSLEFEERLIYFNIMLEILFPPSIEISNDINEDDMDSTRGTDDAASTSGTTFDSSGDTSLNDAIICRLRKRPYNSNDENEDESGRPKKIPPGNLSLCDDPAPRNSPNDVIFDIVKCLHNGKPAKKLLIFTSAERKQCYEFIFRRRYYYKCVQCFAQKKVTSVKHIVNDGGSKSFNFNIGQQHVCEPIEYLQSNYQSSFIIKSPNYRFIQLPWNGQMKCSLIIFDRDDKNLCYKLGYDSCNKFFQCIPCRKRGLTFIARSIHHDGENAIEIGHTQHVCEARKYIP